MERPSIQQPTQENPSATLYSVDWISSGSTLLDLTLGGGWAGGRIFNLVGDRSTGKTLLCIEAFANFKRLFPKGRVRYGEAESAFDEEFARTLGFPDDVEKPEKPLETVEDFYADILAFTTKNPGPSFYVLDSLDALSDNAEKKRGMEETNTYGVEKAKKLSELFRRITQHLGQVHCTLGIVSQVRENIGVTYGDGLTRSGGKALDFYASQVIWLKEEGKIERQVKNQKMTTGVEIKARCKKNKVGLPFREAYFSIIFGYGVDDLSSMVSWLKDISAYNKIEADNQWAEITKARNSGDYPKLKEMQEQLSKRVKIEWSMIEDALRPKARKYV